MFYISRHGEQKGPFEAEIIMACLKQGTFDYSDLVWKEGWENWKAISEVFPEPVAEPPLQDLLLDQSFLPPPLKPETPSSKPPKKLKLKNDSGLIREVPTGFSWTGFFFQYFVLFYRGLFSRGILLLSVVVLLQISSCTVKWSAGLAATARGASESQIHNTMEDVNIFSNWFIFLPFAILIGFKINKWTARYWLDKGYRPIGRGWQTWGRKWGLDTSSLPSD